MLLLAVALAMCNGARTMNAEARDEVGVGGRQYSDLNGYVIPALSTFGANESFDHEFDGVGNVIRVVWVSDLLRLDV